MERCGHHPHQPGELSGPAIAVVDVCKHRKLPTGISPGIGIVAVEGVLNELEQVDPSIPPLGSHDFHAHRHHHIHRLGAKNPVVWISYVPLFPLVLLLLIGLYLFALPYIVKWRDGRSAADAN